MAKRTKAFGLDLRGPMLSTCTAHGCTTIVFGRGTCVAHDPLVSAPVERGPGAGPHDHVTGRGVAPGRPAEAVERALPDAERTIVAASTVE